MRIVHNDKELLASFKEAKSEALSAFGDDTIFIEKNVFFHLPFYKIIKETVSQFTGRKEIPFKNFQSGICL